MSSRNAVAYFNREAERLSSRYDSVDFEAVHKNLGPFLPAPGSWVADIGAGSGRDALALAKRGYNVVAVEPSAALRQIAIAKDEAHIVTWLDGKLPSLSKLKAQRTKFQLVICSAVIMFLKPVELVEGFTTMAELLETDGILWVTYRQIALKGDPRFFHHDHRCILKAAEYAGFEQVGGDTSDDLLGRTTEWQSIALRRL